VWSNRAVANRLHCLQPLRIALRFDFLLHSLAEPVRLAGGFQNMGSMCETIQ
jgi:hypothetical protein